MAAVLPPVRHNRPDYGGMEANLDVSLTSTQTLKYVLRE